MSFRSIRDTREGFVNMGAGDGLISIESKILAIASFIGMLIAGSGIVAAVVIGLLVGFIFPWLVGLIRAVAIVVAVGFSIVWAVMGYFLGGAILGDNAGAGLIIALIVFIISFMLHKIFGGIGYESVDKISLDAQVQSANNTSQTNQMLTKMHRGQTKFCICCGTQLPVNASFCSKCGNPQ